MLMEQVVRSLVVMRRKMRKPVLDNTRIAQPSSLDIAHPASEAGGDSQQEHGLGEFHGAFRAQYTH
ncbi:hypothetical protein D3C80_2102880 [compost metagenome]